jgi:branched-chain amino acid aminotransferase
MINFNGNLESQEHIFSNNRAFKYGDAVFETIKVVNGVILFWEDHYFRLMASMRIVRMEIPMQFTMEFLEKEIVSLIEANNLEGSPVRIRMTVYRDSPGLYTPDINDTGYFIEAKSLQSATYLMHNEPCIVDLFKDHYITPQLLSTLKTTNRVLNVIAGIFAKENELDNCLLLNSDKQVVEAINGNLFLVKGNVIKTPPLKDGCLKGIMRQQLIGIIGKLEGYTLEEASISPFELQKADELFVTNVIQGIKPITKYRKKNFISSVANILLIELNKISAGMQLMGR